MFFHNHTILPDLPDLAFLCFSLSCVFLHVSWYLGMSVLFILIINLKIEKHIPPNLSVTITNLT